MKNFREIEDLIRSRFCVFTIFEVPSDLFFWSVRFNARQFRASVLETSANVGVLCFCFSSFALM